MVGCKRGRIGWRGKRSQGMARFGLSLDCV